jgi:hypothetical protein
MSLVRDYDLILALLVVLVAGAGYHDHHRDA